MRSLPQNKHCRGIQPLPLLPRHLVAMRTILKRTVVMSSVIYGRSTFSNNEKHTFLLYPPVLAEVNSLRILPMLLPESQQAGINLTTFVEAGQAAISVQRSWRCFITRANLWRFGGKDKEAENFFLHLFCLWGYWGLVLPRPSFASSCTPTPGYALTLNASTASFSLEDLFVCRGRDGCQNGQCKSYSPRHTI